MKDCFAPGLIARIRKPEKIALFRASRIGDFVCAIPAFKALRAALPHARITLIGLPFVRDLVTRSPYLDSFVPFSGFPGIAEQFFKARQAVRFFNRMQSEKYHLAIQMHGSGVYSNTFTLMLGARATAGFVRAEDSPGRLDAAFVMPSAGHETERLLALTSFLGAASVGAAPEFHMVQRDHAMAGALLRQATPPFIGIHLFSRKPEKCWPADRFIGTAVQLRARYGGTIVLIGGMDNTLAAQNAAEAFNFGCLDLTGRTSVGTLGAVISRLGVLITNDSGPAHIAYALGVPTVTIFGETDPERWGPPVQGPFRVVRRALPCSPCNETTCSCGYACLRSVGVEEVAEAASGVFRKDIS